MKIMDLKTMSDRELFGESLSAIWAGARGEARGGDVLSYRHATEVMRESDRRLVEAGHSDRCESGIYRWAYEVATADHAGRPSQRPECSCGAAR